MRASPSHHASPLHAAWVPCNVDAHDMERTHASPTRRVCHLHAACILYMPCASATCRVRPLYPGRARLGEDARVPYTPDARGVERTRAAWRGRARRGEYALVPY